MTTPRVSVIVPARNSLAHVHVLVEALAVQTVPTTAFELVLADDGSTDGTLEWLEARRSPWIRVVPGPPLNSYAARNRAVAASRGSVLAFCDADCVPDHHWLEHGLEALEEADVVAGRVRFIVPKRRTVWTLLDMDSSKDHEREVRNATAETANLVLRRKLYDRVGGFEENIPEFGDFDFVQRAVASGATLAFGDDVVVWHPTRDKAKPFLRAHWIYSRGYGVREGEARRRPGDLRWRALVPVVSVFRTRRWWGRSIGPDRRWLGENGVTPTLVETFVSLPLLYLFLPYFRAAAQFIGWREGRRRARARPHATTDRSHADRTTG